jgi:prepilin-type N-terminal cleavage/methylation domain-containing protein
VLHRLTAPTTTQRATGTPATQRDGITLVELLVVLAIASIILGYGFLRIGAAADRAAVRAAVAEAVTLFDAARQAAIERREPVAISIDTARSSLAILAGDQRILWRNLWAAYAVRLAASRDSMAYDARGIGIGVANLSLVARRGRAAETVFVSRLGRVRH